MADLTRSPATWLLELWTAPLLALAGAVGARETLAYDAENWATHSAMGHLNRLGERARFAWLVTHFPEFRNLIHFRLRSIPLPLRLLARLLWRPERTLHLVCDSIGPGLFIQHGFATTITAESVGRDCWVNQQVTIGWAGKGAGKGRPIIGDRVRVGAGAIVIGKVRIGDDAVIGANATVVRDVAPGAVLVAPEAVALPPRT